MHSQRQSVNSLEQRMSLPEGRLRFVGGCAPVLALTLCLAFGAAKSAAAVVPVTGPDLVLWLDAQDMEGKGGTSNQPPHGEAIAAWADNSSYRHHALQAVPQQRPTYLRNAMENGLPAVHFQAARQQHLSAGSPAALDLSLLTAFVVARAAKSDSDMWLFSKNHWGPPWTGYGIAISNDGLRPWPHLGLETGDHGYFQFGGDLNSRFRIVEVRYDGKIAQGRLETSAEQVQVVSGRIATNSQPLTIGTGASQFLEGDIAEILIYRRALNDKEREQTRRYLMEKYDLPLSHAEARDSPLVSDWLFQAEERPWAERIRQELGWTRELAARLARDPRTPDLGGDLADLESLAGKAAAAGSPALGGRAARELYLAVRRVKRSILFKNPAVDFTQLLFIDQPLPLSSPSGPPPGDDGGSRGAAAGARWAASGRTGPPTRAGNARQLLASRSFVRCQEGALLLQAAGCEKLSPV